MISYYKKLNAISTYGENIKYIGRIYVRILNRYFTLWEIRDGFGFTRQLLQTFKDNL